MSKLIKKVDRKVRKAFDIWPIFSLNALLITQFDAFNRDFKLFNGFAVFIITKHSAAVSNFSSSMSKMVDYSAVMPNIFDFSTAM